MPPTNSEGTALAHLAACAKCQGRLGVLRREERARVAYLEEGRTSEVDAPPPSLPPSHHVLAPGSKVGRYVVLEKIGAGGMGVVYAAFDAELNRKVALKLLYGTGAALGPAARERLLREAQAMAQLQHPNVVALYDVGTLEDGVFLAMQYVEGVTLKAWGRARERGWREWLRVMLEAGKGLAAAHAKGLVHRDFKPDNVLVAKDGAVYVTDFGLARAVGSRTPDPATAAPTSEPFPAVTPRGTGDPTRSGASRLTLNLTQGGAVMGTPGYMAPEQLLRKEANARTDLFSFCVTLFEGLYGQKPFGGGTAAQYLQALKSQPLELPRKHPRVPARVGRWVLRGLERTPEARPASMGELLLALERAQKRPWVASVVAVTLLVALGLAGWAHQRSQANRVRACQEGLGAVSEAWNPQLAEATARTFRATGLPYAEDSLGRVTQALNTYAAQWSRLGAQVCEATVRRTAPPPESRLQRECLARRRLDLETLVALFANADVKTVEHAAAAVGRLGALQWCSDAAYLRAGLGLPDDPLARTQSLAVQKNLAEAKSRLEAGNGVEGLRFAQAALDGARGIPFPPLEAEALYLQGALHRDAASYAESVVAYQKAFFLAEALGNDEVKAQAATGLLYVDGLRLLHFEDAALWRQLALAALQHMGGNASLEVEVLSSSAEIQCLQKKPEEGLQLAQKAVELSEKNFGRAGLETGRAFNALSNAFLANGNLPEAVRASEGQLASFEATLGTSNPALDSALENLALLHCHLGELPKARAFGERALQVTQSYGKGSLWEGLALETLGLVLTRSGEPARGLALVERALPMLEKSVGRNDDYSSSRVVAGLAHAALHEDALARRDCGEARAFQEKQGLSRDTLNEDDAFTCEGAALVALGQPDQAVTLLERGLASSKHFPDDLARAHFVLARAQWASRSRPAALAQARQARDEFAALGNFEDAQREVEVWLAEHALPRVRLP